MTKNEKMIEELMEELVATAAKEAEPQGDTDVIGLGYIRPAIARVFSRHEHEDEPLEELAKRKGKKISGGIVVEDMPYVGEVRGFTEMMSKARAYLETLEDKGEGE